MDVRREQFPLPGGHRGPVVLTSGTIYFYASTSDGGLVWQGDNIREIRGNRYGMRRVDLGRRMRGRSEALRELRAAHTFCAQLTDLCRVDRRGAAFVDPGSLCFGDPLRPTLAPQARLEFGEDAEHVEKRVPGRSARVDRLLGADERGALRADRADDRLKVGDRPGEAVDPRHHKRVPLAQEFEDRSEFAPAGCRRAARLEERALP